MFHGHGDDGYRYNLPILADFSTNVYQGGAPAGLKAHLFETWEGVLRYPEVLSESLRRKIALTLRLPEEQVLITSGTTESIYLIAQLFRGKRSAIVVPAFAEYEDACRMHAHKISFVRWDRLKEADLRKTDALFICNPNNPTGEICTGLGELILGNPNTIFVVDEAFAEFTLSKSSLIPGIRNYPNAIVLRSMTKAYAIPGLRLGYVLADPSMLTQIQSKKLPWTVNSMAIQAGHYIFDHPGQFSLPLAEMHLERDRLMTELSPYMTPLPSATHYFLAELSNGRAAGLKKYLLDQHQLLIRDAGNFRTLSDRHIRLASLGRLKNELLLNALSEWRPL